jgi:predicted MFS family arabinose efflux permease
MRLGGLWRDSDFRKLWAGQAVSQIGSRITREGLPLTAVLVLGASPLQMGILNGAGAAAILIFGLFAGAWADRQRRRPILIAADLGRALVLGCVPLAVVLHRLTIGHLYLVAAASAILTVLFDVSYQAYLPSLVSRENILEGNSKLALTESIAEVAGPGLTGLLVQAITAPMAILFDAVSFVCSAFSVWSIRGPEAPPARGSAPNMAREIAEGLETLWRNPVLRALALRAGTLGLFGGVFSGLYVLYAIRDLGLSPALLGAVISVGGASSLLGALVAEWVGHRFGTGRTLIGAAVVGGLAALLTPLARGPALVGAAILSVGQAFDMIWPIYNIHELSVRQAVTPRHLLGRVNSAMHLVFRVSLPVGALAGGALAQIIGIRNTLFIGAIGSMASPLWLVFSPVRHLREIGAKAADCEN